MLKRATIVLVGKDNETKKHFACVVLENERIDHRIELPIRAFKDFDTNDWHDFSLKEIMVDVSDDHIVYISPYGERTLEQKTTFFVDVTAKVDSGNYTEEIPIKIKLEKLIDAIFPVESLEAREQRKTRLMELGLNALEIERGTS